MASSVVGALIRRHQQSIALGAAAVLLVGLSFVPAAAPLVEFLLARASGAALLASSRLWALLLRSLALAGSVTIIALLIGVPLGVLLSRTDVAARRAAWMLHALPMFLPPFLIALGWFHLFGRQGLLGSEASGELLFGWPGVVGILALSFAPIATTLTGLGLLGVDASLEEAARVVAKPWRAMTRVLLPATWPAVALAAIIIFALALSEVGVPMFLRVNVYAAAVFARLGGIDYAPGEAAALGLPLSVVALGLALAERRTRRGRSFAVLRIRGGSREPIALGRFRAPASAACWAVAALSVAPTVALGIKAVRGGGFREVYQWIGSSLSNSLFVAALSATIIAGLGLVIGHAAARGSRGAAILDALAVAVFVVPAPVLGSGLIAVWNQPATQAIYGGMGILVVGAVAHYAVIGLRVVAVSTAQSSSHLEDAAAAAGASFLRRLFWIVVPVHSRGILAAWLLALVFVLRDFEMSVLCYPPGGEPLTVRIFTLEANGPGAVVAALAVLHVALTASVLGVGAWFLVHRRWT